MKAVHYAIVGFSTVLVSMLAAAQQPPTWKSAAVRQATSPTVPLDIPPQPMEKALQAFAAQSGLQVIFPTELTQAISSPGLKGTYTPENALNKLLANTNLKFEYVNERTVAIRSANASTAESSQAPKTTRTVEDKERPLALAKAQAPNQSIPTEDERPTDSAAVEQEVLVLGRNPQSTLAKGVIPRNETGAFQYEVITHEEIKRSGATSVPELMRTLPQNAAAGTSSQATVDSRQGVAETSGVSLRGFGPNQTLVLLNDRRLAAADGGAPNSLAVPLSLVERVEILPAAASAMYGSGALGGVVNYILRTDFTGVEIATYLGATSDSLARERRINLIAGGELFGGRLSGLLGAEYSDQEKLTSGDRGYAQELIRRRLELDPQGVFGSPSPIPDVPANIRHPTGGSLGIPGSTASTASVPTGHDGVNRGPGVYVPTAGSFNLDRNFGSGFANPAQNTVILPETKTRSVFSQVVYAPWDKLAIFAELLHQKVESPLDAGRIQSDLSAIVPATNPHNPFGMPVRVSFVPLDLDHGLQNSDEVLRIVAGVKGAFGSDWRWSVDYTLWDEETRFRLGQFNFGAMQAALASTNPLTAYNPFADLRTARPNSAALLSTLNGALDSTIPLDQKTYAARVAGSVVRVPAGNVAASLGIERRSFDSSQHLLINGTPLDSSLGTRKAEAVYGEVQVPLVAARNGVRGISDLSLSGAARYEDLTDFGSSVNVSIGARYLLTPSFGFRASYSTGTFPPRVSQVAPPTTVQNVGGTGTDPRRNNEVIGPHLNTFGGNPALDAEDAVTRSIGLLIVPSSNRVQLTVDYWTLEKTDAITSLNTTTLLANEAFFPERVIRGPNRPGDPPGIPGPIVGLDATPVNASIFRSEGIDASFRATQELGRWGDLTLDVASTHMLDFERQVLPASPIQDVLGRPTLVAGAPVRNKASATLAHQRRALDSAVTVRRISRYHSSNPVLEGESIPAAVEIDINFAVDAAELIPAGWSGGLNLALGARNVLDERPPFQAGHGYSLFNDPRQRFIYARITKSF